MKIYKKLFARNVFFIHLEILPLHMAEKPRTSAIIHLQTIFGQSKVMIDDPSREKIDLYTHEAADR